jgi:site-specific DNA-methyltransferase (adenine-specific)
MLSQLLANLIPINSLAKTEVGKLSTTKVNIFCSWYNYNMKSRAKYILNNVDCRKAIKELPDNSVDFIVTDPPYFIDGMGDDWNDTKLNTKKSKSGVVGGLPVGMKFDRDQGQKLQNFLEPICVEFFRVLKPGGFCVVFSQGRLYHRTAMALDVAGFEIRDLLGWKYEGQAKAFSQTHFIKKDKSMTEKEKSKLIKELEGLKTPQLKPQIEPMTLAQKPKEGTFVENWKKYQVGLVDVRETLDGMFPGTVMEISKKVRKNESEANLNHMTVKPVVLISHLIKLFTHEGQTVLDPFVGSGSHGVAALQTNRNFIGFEIEPKYYKIADKRLKDTLVDSNKTKSLKNKNQQPFILK